MNFEVSKSDKGKPGIYCIVCYSTGDMYIGSTSNLYKRYKQHCDSASRSSARMYQTIREIGQEHFRFIALKYFVRSRSVRLAEERVLIKRLSPSLNTMLNKEHIGPFNYKIDEANRTLLYVLTRCLAGKRFCSESGISRHSFKRFRNEGRGSLADLHTLKHFVQTSEWVNKYYIYTKH